MTRHAVRKFRSVQCFFFKNYMFRVTIRGVPDCHNQFFISAFFKSRRGVKKSFSDGFQMGSRRVRDEVEMHLARMLSTSGSPKQGKPFLVAATAVAGAYSHSLVPGPPPWRRHPQKLRHIGNYQRNFSIT